MVRILMVARYYSIHQDLHKTRRAKPAPYSMSKLAGSRDILHLVQRFKDEWELPSTLPPPMCPAGVDRDNFSVTSWQSQSNFVIRTNEFNIITKKSLILLASQEIYLNTKYKNSQPFNSFFQMAEHSNHCDVMAE